MSIPRCSPAKRSSGRLERLCRSVLAPSIGLWAVASSVALPADASIAPAKSQPTASTRAVQILVLRENGVGSASTAQRYVDGLVQRLAEVNEWHSATARYQTRRKAAESWIVANRPDFALMTLPAFLSLRKQFGLKVIGSVDVPNSGGRQYHIVSQSHPNLAACRGKTLASNHAADPQFVARIVAAGEFELGDFSLIPTRRPVQTLKAVVRGKAECALIDDAQHAQIAKMADAGKLRSIWSSKKLPPMVVVAFPATDKKTKVRFQNRIPKVCKGAGKTACDEAGIRTLLRATAAKYSAVITAYDS